jgi:hypothetical protein
MVTQPNRLTVTLDEDSLALLKSLEKHTGLSPAQTMVKLWPSHLDDLWTYLTWLDQLPEGPSHRRSLGLNLLQSFGPETLREGIKRIDPSYQTEGEKFAQGLKS